MRALCTVKETHGGEWQAHHASAALGKVNVTASSREDVLRKMQSELQYRLELCPCSGEWLGTVELQVSDDPG